jgi:hypothetical protein
MIDKFKWAIHMVIQPKKYDPKKLRICVNFQGLNNLIVTDLFPTPFINEIINEVVGLECYSFIDNFLGYKEVPISEEA